MGPSEQRSAAEDNAERKGQDTKKYCYPFRYDDSFRKSCPTIPKIIDNVDIKARKVDKLAWWYSKENMFEFKYYNQDDELKTARVIVAMEMFEK